MRSEIDMDEIEAALEKIWDLHDKVSDAIHAISRAHFLKSIKTGARVLAGKKLHAGGGEEGKDGGGFVFVKDLEAEDDGTIAEAKSLNAIRTALENFEDQLEFFHTVQSQQQAERDAALARLEQSRIILAMILVEHHGKKYKVIDEALSFIGDFHDHGRFITPENLYEKAKSNSNDDKKAEEGKKASPLMRLLLSGMTLAKKSLKLDGGIIGNAALFAVSMFALFHIHQGALKGSFCLDAPLTQEHISSRSYLMGYDLPQHEKHARSKVGKQLDVFLARG